MSELKQLKKRIDQSNTDGVLTSEIQEDYSPCGQLMIKNLCDSGDYVQRRMPMYRPDSEWRIFKREYKPY